MVLMSVEIERTYVRMYLRRWCTGVRTYVRTPVTNLARTYRTYVYVLRPVRTNVRTYVHVRQRNFVWPHQIPSAPFSANICSGCPPGGLQCCRGGRAWTEAEWQASLAPVGKTPTIFRHQNNTSTLVSYRIAVGMAYHDWRAAAGANSKSMYAEFARSYFEMRGQRLERRHRDFVKRCARQAKQGILLRPNGMHDGCSEKTRRRQRGRQGRKCRAGFLRDALWDWFVDIRSAVKCRLPPKVVLGQAQRMADEMSRDMARAGEFVLMPKLDRQWLRRWQRDYGVLGLSLTPPVKLRLRPTW